MAPTKRRKPKPRAAPLRCRMCGRLLPRNKAGELDDAVVRSSTLARTYYCPPRDEFACRARYAKLKEAADEKA